MSLTAPDRFGCVACSLHRVADSHPLHEHLHCDEQDGIRQHHPSSEYWLVMSSCAVHRFRYTYITFHQKRMVDNMYDAVGALNIWSEYGYVSIVPLDRITCCVCVYARARSPHLSLEKHSWAQEEKNKRNCREKTKTKQINLPFIDCLDCYILSTYKISRAVHK